MTSSGFVVRPKKLFPQTTRAEKDDARQNRSFRNSVCYAKRSTQIFKSSCCEIDPFSYWDLKCFGKVPNLCEDRKDKNAISFV